MKKQRRYGTQKTTTKQGKAEYMRPYMVSYRKDERELLHRAITQFGWKRKNNKSVT
jgi:hypothetical protein